jgi:hypothetical protein
VGLTCIFLCNLLLPQHTYYLPPLTAGFVLLRFCHVLPATPPLLAPLHALVDVLAAPQQVKPEPGDHYDYDIMTLY